MVQRRGLSEADFRGSRFADWPCDLRGNNDLLNLTRPDVIADIARQYVRAGADIISTNTFNANAISMADYAMEALAPEMAREGARIARAVADSAPRPVWVAGSIGPTNKTASMSPSIDDPGFRAVTYRDLYDAYRAQIEALLEGGVDILLFETVFDTLNLKAGLAAAADIAAGRGSDVPIMVSVTIAGKDGRTFSGQTLEAFIDSISHAPVSSLGLNCSFGPREIEPWLRRLAELSPWPVSCHPNAGLPDASGAYTETPESMARVVAGMCRDGLVNIVGGCCGTTPDHIAAIAAAAAEAAPRPLPGDVLPSSTRLAGLDRLDTASRPFINVGERCNVAGSRKFLRLISEKKYDEALAIARRQIDDGADIIDINMDDGLLDAREEMCRFLNLLAAEPDIARVPVMVDSSDWEVVTAALECIQGKPVVNSISLKEGEEVFLSRAAALRRAGAAVVVMAFDEQGQAVTYQRKIEVCQRAYRLLTGRLGFPPSDIIFDPNILTVATGIPEHDRYALDFIRATRWITDNLPGSHVSGGLSNLSFAFRGNNPLREAMHSVFLHHAVEAGMSMAILNPATRVAYDSIEPALRSLLEDVILCRRHDASDRLAAYAEAHPAVKGAAPAAERQTATPRELMSVDERLIDALVRGDGSRLDADLSEALAAGADPVAIIDGPLMKGMERVGALFGEGRMFLPQVVKTARTMKQAVAVLSPEIARRGAGAGKARAGKVVFATVKGDVHDIGKNIVSIILACNNYEVIDLGVMVPAEKILEAVREHKPDIVCLSGLITPSLAEMTHVAEVLDKAGIDTPIMVGGATTSALHTALKIDPVYRGAVIHVTDASQNPLLAATLLNPVTRAGYIMELKDRAKAAREDYEARRRVQTLTDIATARARHYVTASPAAAPVALGRRELSLPVERVAPLINWRAYLAAWSMPATLHEAFGLVDADSATRESWITAQSAPDKAAEALRLAEATLAVLDKVVAAADAATVRAVVSFNACRVTPGDLLCIEGAEGNSASVDFPVLRRQTPDNEGLFTSISDFIYAGGDYIGAFAVTVSMPEEVLDTEDEYHRLIAELLSHRLAEAGAEYLQSLAAAEMWSGLDRGIRPAVGYPSLPDQTLMHNLDKLLDMERIGIKVTSNGALEPAASVAGLYIANPDARYTLLGPLADDQLALYAEARSLPLATVRSILNR